MQKPTNLIALISVRDVEKEIALYDLGDTCPLMIKIRAAQASNLCPRIILASRDDAVIQAARNTRVEIFHLPDTDSQSSNDVLAAALDYIGPDINAHQGLLYLELSAPFLTPDDIINAAALMQDDQADFVLSLSTVQTPEEFMKLCPNIRGTCAQDTVDNIADFLSGAEPLPTPDATTAAQLAVSQNTYVTPNGIFYLLSKQALRCPQIYAKNRKCNGLIIDGPSSYLLRHNPEKTLTQELKEAAELVQSGQIDLSFTKSIVPHQRLWDQN